MSYEYCDACYEEIHIHQSSHILNVFESSPLTQMSKGYRLTPFAHVCNKCEIQTGFSDLFVDVFFELMSEEIDQRRHSNLAANDPFYNESTKPSPESFLCSFCEGHIPSIEAILVIWRHDIAWSQDPFLASSMKQSDIMQVKDLLIACAPCSQTLDLYELAKNVSDIVVYILNETDPSEGM